MLDFIGGGGGNRNGVHPNRIRRLQTKQVPQGCLKDFHPGAGTPAAAAAQFLFQILSQQPLIKRFVDLGQVSSYVVKSMRKQLILQYFQELKEGL